MKAIIFSCDGGKRGHSFTLQKAVDSGMFTEKEGENIKKSAILHINQYAPKE